MESRIEELLSEIVLRQLMLYNINSIYRLGLLSIKQMGLWFSGTTILQHFLRGSARRILEVGFRF